MALEFEQFINTDFGVLAIPPLEAEFIEIIVPKRKDGEPDRRTVTGRIAARYISDQCRLAEQAYLAGGQMTVAQSFAEWRKAAS